MPAVRYERLLQPPAKAGAHHPAQQESQQSGDPAARYRLHPGPAAGAGDAPGSAEAAAPAGATAPPGRDLSSRAAADPAHSAQHGPGERPGASRGGRRGDPGGRWRGGRLRGLPFLETRVIENDSTPHPAPTRTHTSSSIGSWSCQRQAARNERGFGSKRGAALGAGRVLGCQVQSVPRSGGVPRAAGWSGGIHASAAFGITNTGLLRVRCLCMLTFPLVFPCCSRPAP